jgi:hypothetical protein
MPETLDAHRIFRRKSKKAMRTRGGLLLLTLHLLSACANIPTGPSVLVLPAVGKPMDVFQAEDIACRAYAQHQLGVAPAQQALYDRAYSQCMYSKGNVVPGVMVTPGGSAVPPPLPAVPPRP